MEERQVTITCSDVGVRSRPDELELDITATDGQLAPIADDLIAQILTGRY